MRGSTVRSVRCTMLAVMLLRNSQDLWIGVSRDVLIAS
jgi:hypothetical protein